MRPGRARFGARRVRTALIYIVIPILALVVAQHFATTESHAKAPQRSAGRSLPRVRGLAPRRPNVLVFVADDQTQGTVTPDVMPSVYQTMVAQGRSYPNFTDADPLCCPSRASIMTGRYDHNNGVHGNLEATALHVDQHSMIQCYLRSAGYYTGLYGKYLNNYPLTRSLPCMSDYAKNPGQAHSGLPFNTNGKIVSPPGYTDDYSQRRAIRYLRLTEAHDRRPWYLYFASTYPHSPYSPRPQYADAQLSVPDQPGDAAGLAETDITDKNPVIAEHQGPPGTNETMLAQLQMLRTVDDEFQALVSRLRADHELRDTLIVYVSDNGYLFGEHGLWGKGLPYSQSIRAPMMIRFPGHLAGGTTDARFAQNIDIARTILRATGIKPTLRHRMDGRNLLSRRWNRRFSYNEQWHLKTTANGTGWQPSWRSLRTPTYQYIEWYTADMGRVTFREYYDLTTDPGETSNLLADGNDANDPDVARLHARLLAESRCAGIKGHGSCK